RHRSRLTLHSRIIAAAILAPVALGTGSGTAMIGPGPASPGRDSAVESAASGADTTTHTTPGAFTVAPPRHAEGLRIGRPSGKVSGSDISLDLTSAGGAVAPVELDPVEPFEPKPEAPKEPVTINVLAGPGGAPAQDLVSNGKGCAAGCIESALLHRQIRKT